VDLQGLCEGCDRRKQPLLEADKSEPHIASLLQRETSGAGPDGFAILGKLLGQKEFWRVARQASDADFLDDPFRKCLAEVPKVGAISGQILTGDLSNISGAVKDHGTALPQHLTATSFPLHRDTATHPQTREARS
jgi:hypothetical protein